MKKIQNAAISFIGYRVADIVYHCAPGFEFPEGKVSYTFNFQKNTEILSDKEIQENLTVNVYYPEDENDTKLKLSITMAGRFNCSEKWDDKWEANILAIMFPYLRGLVSMITSNSGREPIILPTVNLAAMFPSKGKQD